MNTAEAIAAGLFIAGFQEDSRRLLYPFSYGAEFLRLNSILFDSYARCRSEADINEASEHFLAGIEEKKKAKAARNEARQMDSRIGGYMDDMDLPPRDSEDEYEKYYEEEDEADGDGGGGGEEEDR
jgi:pre-rRNA-processing protein TSR3